MGYVGVERRDVKSDNSDQISQTLPYFGPKWSKFAPYFRPKRLENHTLRWGCTYPSRSRHGHSVSMPRRGNSQVFEEIARQKLKPTPKIFGVVVIKCSLAAHSTHQVIGDVIKFLAKSSEREGNAWELGSVLPLSCISRTIVVERVCSAHFIDYFARYRLGELHKEVIRRYSQSSDRTTSARLSASTTFQFLVAGVRL